MIEALSYWKVTCSPEIKIRVGKLDKNQVKWWKDLIINGMGQFFYENKIDWKELKSLKESPILKSKTPEPSPVSEEEKFDGFSVIR